MDSSCGNESVAPQAELRGDREQDGRGVDEEARSRYGESVDDADAASLGRSCMADGRRVELTVEELAQALGAAGVLEPRESSPGQAGTE